MAVQLPYSKIRDRVGLSLKLTERADLKEQEAALHFIRKERTVELAFEDHRFWDIRRWMIGDVVKDIYGVKITKKGSKYSYTPVKIQTRVWEEKMNLYPIAQSEIYKNGNLTQNDGWE